jgi:hypothetical protein
MADQPEPTPEYISLLAAILFQKGDDSEKAVRRALDLFLTAREEVSEWLVSVKRVQSRHNRWKKRLEAEGLISIEEAFAYQCGLPKRRFKSLKRFARAVWDDGEILLVGRKNPVPAYTFADFEITGYVTTRPAVHRLLEKLAERDRKKDLERKKPVKENPEAKVSGERGGKKQAKTGMRSGERGRMIPSNRKSATKSGTKATGA